MDLHRGNNNLRARVRHSTCGTNAFTFNLQCFRSLVCATAPSSVALIIGRAIAGIGVGGLFSGAITILAYTCKSRRNHCFPSCRFWCFGQLFPKIASSRCRKMDKRADTCVTEVPLRKRPAAFGLVGGMWGIASVAGPLLGGVFTSVTLDVDMLSRC
jgi:MFS family permease